jgi:uncharacterized protein (DUF433 family)
MNSTTTHSASPPTETRIIPVISGYTGIRPGYCVGEPHILGHRIKVRHVAIWHEDFGMSPAEIVATYPTIPLAQVHAALAYYFDHGDEIRAAIVEEDRFVEDLKANSGPALLQEKLRQRNAADNRVQPV